MPPLVTVSTCCSLRVRARWCSSYHVRSGSSVGQSFKLLLITFSWRFLLILAPERARRLSWGVAPNPAKVGRAVRKYPHSTFSVYLFSNTLEKGEAIALHTGEEHLAQALLVPAPRSEAS